MKLKDNINIFAKSPIILIIYLLINLNYVYGQVIEVPIEVQLPIIMKVLSLERNLNAKAQTKGKINLGVVYQSKFRNSLLAKNYAELFFKENSKLLNRDLIVTLISINDNYDVEQTLANTKFDVILLTPLRAVNIESIANLTERLKILTVSLIPDYTNSGISVGIELIDDKPRIIINTTSSKLEGANFNSDLLKLSRIIN